MYSSYFLVGLICCFFVLSEGARRTLSSSRSSIRTSIRTSRISRIRTSIRTRVSIPSSNRCLSHPCENQGTCVRSQISSTFTCRCRYGFTGTRCEHSPQHPCDENPCQNGGECQNVDDEQIRAIQEYRCTCASGEFHDQEVVMGS
jgi:hypothetical protein